MQSRPGKCPICNSTSELELFDGDARHLYDVKCPRWTRCRRACSSPTPGAICAAAAAAPSASQPGPHGTPPAAKASLTSGSGLRAAASAYRLSPGLDLGAPGQASRAPRAAHPIVAPEEIDPHRWRDGAPRSPQPARRRGDQSSPRLSLRRHTGRHRRTRSRVCSRRRSPASGAAFNFPVSLIITSL